MNPRDEANKYLSLYIRLRDAISWNEKNHVDITEIQPDLLTVRCCTCPRTGGWKSFDCGHYFGRSTGGGQSALIFHEDNCHAQCTVCNRDLGGHLGQYKIFMLNKFGPARLKAMEIENRQIGDMSSSTLTAIAEHYKGLYNGLLEKF